MECIIKGGAAVCYRPVEKGAAKYVLHIAYRALRKADGE